MSTDNVSVLMPAYNAERFIETSVKSILNQTYKNLKLIILDDNSKDKTWQIIQGLAKFDSRVEIHRNKTNSDIAATRNKLIEYAKSKYIAWQDADDISYPYRIEHQFQYLEAHPKVGIVGGYLVMFDEKGNETLRKYNTHDVILRKLIFRYSPVAQPAAMIRRECFEKTGLYNTNYPPAEDIDMSFRIGCFYEFGNLPEKILKYRMLSTSATYQRLNKIERVTTQVRRQYFTHHKYKATLSDKLYNDLQILSISLIPPQLKIKIFNILRNS